MGHSRFGAWLGAWLFGFGFLPAIAAAGPADSFNELVDLKAGLEHRYGIRTLECFPFLQAVGTNADQAEWVRRCLEGTRTLRQALREFPVDELREVGISTRFLRSGGFHTLMIPWDASPERVVETLRSRLTPLAREQLLSRVRELKRTILRKFAIQDLYCTKKISNDQCLAAYKTLATVPAKGMLAQKEWATVVLSDSLTPGEDPLPLLLRHDQSAGAMEDRLRQAKAQDYWDARRRVYAEMETRFGEGLNRKLQAGQVLCAPGLAAEECLQGAATLFQLSQDPAMQNRPWGRIWINRRNTLLLDDYNVSLRFDLPVEEARVIFSAKPTREQVGRQISRAKRLEELTKNNAAGLRPVCDLSGLSSALCVQGMESFKAFLKSHRRFKARPPWSDLMFVDGAQLSRVNFALNSPSRTSYIYVDARLGGEGLAKRLGQFGADRD